MAGEGALTIATDGVTLDLNGHQVYGCDAGSLTSLCNQADVTDPDPTLVGAFVTGEGPGIVIDRADSVRITDSSTDARFPGTVRDFDTGIVIRGGNFNVIEKLDVTNNVGTVATDSDYGEGIGIYSYLNGATWEGSTNNVVRANNVVGNGPFAGIGLYNFDDTKPGSQGPVCSNPPGATNTHTNTIGGPATDDGNVVRDSFVIPNGTSYQDDGIRIEPMVCTTTVQNNKVSGSSLEGIAVFADAWDSKVLDNVVQANGAQPLLTQRKGDGIRVFLRAQRTMVQRNTVCANAGSGISVDSSTVFPATGEASTIQANKSGTGVLPGTGTPCTRNAVGPDLPTRLSYDLLEGGHTAATESCRHVWSGNTAGLGGAFPTCTAQP